MGAPWMPQQPGDPPPPPVPWMMNPQDPMSPFYGETGVSWTGGGAAGTPDPSVVPPPLGGPMSPVPPSYRQPTLLGQPSENPILSGIMSGLANFPQLPYMGRRSPSSGSVFAHIAAPMLAHMVGAGYEQSVANEANTNKVTDAQAVEKAKRDFELEKIPYTEQARVAAEQAAKDVVVTGPNGEQVPIPAQAWFTEVNKKTKPGPATVEVTGPNGEKVPISSNVWFAHQQRAQRARPFQPIDEGERMGLSQSEATYRETLKKAAQRFYADPKNAQLDPQAVQGAMMSGSYPPEVYKDPEVQTARAAHVAQYKRLITQGIVKVQASGDPNNYDQIASMIPPGEETANDAVSSLIREAPPSVLGGVAEVLARRPEVATYLLDHEPPGSNIGRVLKMHPGLYNDATIQAAAAARAGRLAQARKNATGGAQKASP